MSIKVVGAGFGRTGTASLKSALEQLGFGPAYHMYEVIERPEHSRAWHRITHGGPMEWDLFDGFRSVLDWPAANYWREIAAHYPDAKVLLTTRDPESWYKSISETIFPLVTAPLPADAPDDRRIHREMTVKLLSDTFGGRCQDKRYAMEVFERHNLSVRESIDPSRLLVYEVKQGWDPLCAFLGVTAPDEPFPRLNDTASFLAWSTEDDESA